MNGHVAARRCSEGGDLPGGVDPCHNDRSGASRRSDVDEISGCAGHSDGEGLLDVRRRQVVRIARLRRGDQAATRAAEMNGRPVD